MKRIVISIIFVTALITGNINNLFAQNAEQLYQRGLAKEEGEGALQDAITLYKQVTDNTKADQSLRAKALLHIGMCHEKLGTKEATKAYLQLVRNFPSAKNEVAIAKERLNRLITVEEKSQEIQLVPEFTRIKIPANPGNGLLSPDGKQMAFILDGCVWTAPISGGVDPYIAGEPKKLTGNIGAWDMSNSFCWSGDSKWIAFNVRQGQNKPETYIYVIPSEGGDAQKVQITRYLGSRTGDYRLSLSPDGKILAYVSGNDFIYSTNSTQIFLIPVSGGIAKVLTENGTSEPTWSPDGSKIAYVKHSDCSDGCRAEMNFCL